MTRQSNFKFCYAFATDTNIWLENDGHFSYISQLKEFQSRQQKSDHQPTQNTHTESSSEETPKETPLSSLESSFTSTSYNQDQVTVPQQSYDSIHGTGTNQATDFSAFFNNPAIPGPQSHQHVFDVLADQVQHGQQYQPFSDTSYHHQPNEVYSPQQASGYTPEAQSFTATPQQTFMPPPQLADSFSQISSSATPSAPTVPDVSKQLNDELQDVTFKWNAEMKKNDELAGQISRQNNTIEELQSELLKMKLENSIKTNFDAESLKTQLDAHAETIRILVGDKSELTASLAKYQGLAHSNASEVEELQGRLNASRHRVSVLERDIGNMKSSHEKYDTTQQKLCDELEQCQEEIKKFKKIVGDAEEEIAELKRGSTLKSEKIVSLEQELKKKSSELELSKLRVEQLSIGDVVPTDGQLENLSAQKVFFEQKTQELESVIQQMNAERDQSGQQYQNYVQQLNQEISKLAQQLQEYGAENERLSKREQELVKHVGDLERQIQQQLNKQKKSIEMSGSTEEIDTLKSKSNALEAEKAQWEVSFER